VSQKLGQSKGRVVERAERVKSSRRGSAVKAVYSMARLCPKFSVAPVIGEQEDGGGRWP